MTGKYHGCFTPYFPVTSQKAKSCTVTVLMRDAAAAAAAAGAAAAADDDDDDDTMGNNFAAGFFMQLLLVTVEVNRNNSIEGIFNKC